MASFTSGYRSPGSWEWPEDIPAASPSPPAAKETSESAPRPAPPTAQAVPPPTQATGSQAKPKKTKRYGPRTCRICLETVLPTVHEHSLHLPGMLQGEPRVTYDSEGGRLLQPCKCKGSAKFVHEQCLQEWRHADPGYSRRFYWECPTCNYAYRLGRMSWAHYISSAATQVALTILIFLTTAFVLGFIGDPIINMYLDPLSTITSLPNAYDDPLGPMLDDDERGWALHFMKGFVSLGLFGFVKVLFTIGPWNWFNARQFITRGGGHNANNGRDRMTNMTLIVVFLGIATFLYSVWKLVRAWSRKVLEKASEVVMDVHLNDDEEDDEDES